MNNLKTNPKALDIVIYKVQKKLYDKLSVMWSGIELFGYDRCYLSNRNNVKSIDYYISDKEYESLIVAEKNKFFFTAENEIKNVGINYYETTIELYFIVNVSEIKPTILHRADEEVRQDVLNVLQTMSDVSINSIVFNADNVFNKYFFNQVIDLEPYHCFKVVLNVNKYHLNNKLCVSQNTDNGGVNNGGGSFVCSGGNKYIDISQVFVNPFTPSLETNIKLLPSSEIVDLWLDNENYGNGLGGARIFICLNSFEIGSNVYSGSSNELIGSFFDGYWLANQTGFSGTGSQNGLNINYRYNPIRSTPYSINNPITNQPLPFAFSQDTVEPVIIKIVNSIITEVIPLPITGFAYEG